MRKLLQTLLLTVLFSWAQAASAILSLELTRGVSGAIPIAMVPFATPVDPPPQDVSGIIARDLQNSGRFKVFGRSQLSSFPSDIRDVKANYFRNLGADYAVIGKVENKGLNQYQVTMQIIDMYRAREQAEIVLSKKLTVSGYELRALAHHFSDLIYEKLVGVRGIFSTKLAYVVINHSPNGRTRYSLEVSDQDGYNPRSLLTSREPIMSPNWSPNGKQIAYVSFENRHAAIYLQDVATGSRHVLSEFKGINGAPAWSPDGRKMAVVLSKSGAPNIYIMDIGTKQLVPITQDFYINTEPAWTADGKSLIFTSNRSGGPQLYQVNLNTKQVSRLSYDGDYNARAAITPRGKTLAMIHRVNGVYHIATLDLDTGTTRVLGTSSGDSASPSMAPNNSMILYDMVYHGRNMLAMVSADGSVQLVLPPRNGEAQDPAWSPFLT